MTRPVWPWGRGIQATLLAGFDKVSLSFEERYIEDEMSYGRFGPASLKIRKMPDWMHENDLNVNYYTVLVETRIVNLVLEPLLGFFCCYAFILKVAIWAVDIIDFLGRLPFLSNHNLDVLLLPDRFATNFPSTRPCLIRSNASLMSLRSTISCSGTIWPVANRANASSMSALVPVWLERTIRFFWSSGRRGMLPEIVSAYAKQSGTRDAVQGSLEVADPNGHDLTSESGISASVAVEIILSGVVEESSALTYS
jgi:hypothetical protein